MKRFYIPFAVLILFAAATSLFVAVSNYKRSWKITIRTEKHWPQKVAPDKHAA